ncbi:hypothetical protein XFF6990_290198 [Xanthomonas citri pv. fuscans]|uniref:Uncharacterized protein n=1 Tax=Xanthomonas campestris pv. phaseoli TaxID=317013 RepID=A0A7Z7J2K6_XANCH|nr:hypothetical protein XFF6990_290198 [Xanthomonas citri pv. fuscans]SOO26157.1 hypothetical protein XFF6991_530006 [Xanthomonas phaseoli pv. phaseoli]
MPPSAKSEISIHAHRVADAAAGTGATAPPDVGRRLGLQHAGMHREEMHQVRPGRAPAIL